MINQYPAWKYALIAAAFLVGAVFALPDPSRPAAPDPPGRPMINPR